MLIVGLGNPGANYAKTRHNVGFWLVDILSNGTQAPFKLNKKCNLEIAEIINNSCWIGKPKTYMNESGLPISSYLRYYNIDLSELLIVHDDLDIPAGEIKLKIGGGHGGHNGLRNIIQHLNTTEFKRLRIGISHPGNRHLVHDYVLNKPSPEHTDMILGAIDKACQIVPDLCANNWEKASKELHTKE